MDSLIRRGTIEDAERVSGTAVLKLIFRISNCHPHPMQQHIQAKLIRLALILAASISAAGCMVVPRTTMSYDEECNMVKRSMTLDVKYAEGIGVCRNHTECAGLLVGAGLVSAASVVVSGSVAVVGNVVYWIERQGKCNRSGVVQREVEPSEQSSSTEPATIPSDE